MDILDGKFIDLAYDNESVQTVHVYMGFFRREII